MKFSSFGLFVSFSVASILNVTPVFANTLTNGGGGVSLSPKQLGSLAV
ncbi:hypothetical protein [Helicobacter saguini]|uniref:Uncharacterized protein n=1 Tax=Helicobacter saguini TaxID=1548018 RepID=A0A6L7D8E5_9HELI|nr:hypothetical protein [Helicobacter saguini]MWV62305.1 hypothetical protein [Helicobacter saguini]MWV69371.1 hypothetical protein [Helicobacter saguini]